MQAFRLLCLGASVSLASASGWNYDHQAAWGGHCQGTEQSPINIVELKAARDNPNVHPVTLNYGTLVGYKVIDNGHTYQVTVAPEAVGTHTLGGSLTPEGTGYALAQIHLHWGSPDTDKGSEHLIDNHQTAMEMHFVHYKNTHADVASALASGERDALVVFAVLYQLDTSGGAPNPAIDQFLHYVDEVRHAGDEVVAANDFPIDISKLVPSTYLAAPGSRRRLTMLEPNLWSNFRDPQPVYQRTVYQHVTETQNFFAYLGSLTTPDCNEQVVFTIPNPKVEHMYISRAQLDRLYTLFAAAGHEETAASGHEETPAAHDSPAAEAAAPAAHHWTYHNQAEWPGECTTGKEQSPINVVTQITQHSDATATPMALSYAPVTDWKIAENGHTVQVTVPDAQQAASTVSGGMLTEPYKLWQWHMHWGSEADVRGSEHAIDNERYAMELHLVHYKGKYESSSAALASGDRDALNVVAVLFELDDTAPANPALDLMVAHLKNVPYAGESEDHIMETFDVTQLVPAAFLAHPTRRSESEQPEHLVDNFRDLQPLNGRTVHWFQTGGQSFFGYMGGLTTPDCNEQVVFSVIDPKTHRMTITSAQLSQLYQTWVTPRPGEEPAAVHRRALEGAQASSTGAPVAAFSMLAVVAAVGLAAVARHVRRQNEYEIFSA